MIGIFPCVLAPMIRGLPVLFALLCVTPKLGWAADAATTQPVLMDSRIGLRLYKPAEPADGTAPYSLILEVKNNDVANVSVPRLVLPTPNRAPPVRRGVCLWLVTERLGPPPTRPNLGNVEGTSFTPQEPATLPPGEDQLMRVEVPERLLDPPETKVTAVMTIDGDTVAVSSPILVPRVDKKR